ncbi:MAG TPA: hypothetical protein VGP36_17505 [Mycobacteriales bacterium]|jgi:hypothetical protein|nr:hypothetical protein [Mycobacteriales bacterium]
MLSKSGSKKKKLTKRDGKKELVGPAPTGSTTVAGPPGSPAPKVTFADPAAGTGTPLVTVIPGPAAPPGPPPVRQWGAAAPTQQPSASRAVLDLTAVSSDLALMTAIGLEIGPAHGEKLEMLIEALTAAGRATMTRAELVVLARRIGAAYDQLAGGGQVGLNDALAVDMYQTEVARTGLKQQLTVVGSIPSAQARFTYAFLDANRPLLAYLKQDNLRYHFGAGGLRAWGEGLYENKTVYLGKLDLESPQSFLNMLLHETGHATYQRLLVPDGALPGNGKVPRFWAGGEAQDLEVERTQLEQAVTTAQAAGQPVPPGIVARLADIRAIFDRERPGEPWGKLPAETRELYDAWTVLRQGKGLYLLGVPFTSGADADFRKGYQAEAFGEFIAETFFLTATGELDGHIRTMRTAPGIPDDVRQAWQVTDRILGQHARQTILGRAPAV